MSGETTPQVTEGEAPAATMTARDRLAERQKAREAQLAAKAETDAEKQMRIEDLLDAHVARFGSTTIPRLGDDDKRDPRAVYVDRLMGHAVDDVERAFCELGRVAEKGMKVAMVAGGSSLIIVTGPSDSAYKMFKRRLGKEETRAEASEGLALACGVWPAAAELHKLLRSSPVLVDLCSARCIDLGGASTDPK